MKQKSIKAIALLTMMLSVICANSKDLAPITSFHYKHMISMIMYGDDVYDVKVTPDDKVFVTIDDGNPLSVTIEADHSVIENLQKIVEKYKMYEYKDHYVPPCEVLDGYMWNMSIQFADGKHVYSSGSNAEPNNGVAAFSAVCNLLDGYRIHLWEGTYASCPDGYREYEEHENSYFDNSPYTFTVGPVQSDSTCNITLTSKGNYTLHCTGKINEYNELSIYLNDVKDGLLPSEKPFDWSKPLFVIGRYVWLEDVQKLGIFGEEESVKFAKLKN